MAEDSSSSASTKELQIIYEPPEKTIEEFVEAVKAAYGPDSETLSQFLGKIKCFQELKICAMELESYITSHLVDNARFIRMYSDEVLPFINPRPSEIEKLHFFHSLESAFSSNQNRIELVKIMVRNFCKGKLSLYQMTKEMKHLLEDKSEVREAYVTLLPESAKWFEDEDGDEDEDEDGDEDEDEDGDEDEDEDEDEGGISIIYTSIMFAVLAFLLFVFHNLV